MYLIYKRNNVCDIIQMYKDNAKNNEKKGDERNDSGRNH